MSKREVARLERRVEALEEIIMDMLPLLVHQIGTDQIKALWGRVLEARGILS